MAMPRAIGRTWSNPPTSDARRKSATCPASDLCTLQSAFTGSFDAATGAISEKTASDVDGAQGDVSGRRAAVLWVSNVRPVQWGMGSALAKASIETARDARLTQIDRGNPNASDTDLIRIGVWLDQKTAFDGDEPNSSPGPAFNGSPALQTAAVMEVSA